MPKPLLDDPTTPHPSATASAASGTYRRVPLRRVLERPHPNHSRPARWIDPRAPAVLAVAEALVVTMRASPGCVGLAAPQIGESIRLFAVDVTGHRRARSCAGLVVLVNPRIVEQSADVTMREGCLSVPDFTGDVERAAEIMVEGFAPGSTSLVRIVADGIEARCLQHELDHLDGVLFTDRVMASSRVLFARKTTA
jgi:peptide deformylase